MRLPLVLSLSLSLLLSACGAIPRQSGGDILMIGDSVLAWNRLSGRDAGSQLEDALGRKVVSRAVPGARLEAGPLAAFGGLSIPGQLAGRWNWVVMNGGANDLAALCGCGDCDGRIDALIAPDGDTGAIPDLIAKARAGGAQVLWLGYHDAPASRSFRGCRPALVEIERRIDRLATIREGVHFIDLEDVLDPAAPGVLASDRTHPGPDGSALIGRFVAAEIARLSR